MKNKSLLLAVSALLGGAVSLSGCGPKPVDKKTEQMTLQSEVAPVSKPVVYQVFTRLFGNTKAVNKPWGTIEENGVGKFSDFTPTALQQIKAMGVTHVWYTGVLHHAVVTDYSKYGISQDDPDVVKGRAGSPYAIKDYYNVNPDLANDPSARLAEFEALIERTHDAGLKVIIDIVPNHVARNYESLGAPKGTVDFGANDDTQVAYARDNNFYYVVGEEFTVPTSEGYQVLGGGSHPLADGKFAENPAKWTGNGARAAKPDINDWYETVKVNYGVKPDGSYDFERLPDDYAQQDYRAHFEFWQHKQLPDSWYKFQAITHFWLEKGVDGFRYDMAEMVPVEFWSFLNSSIKTKNPEAFLLAEVYNPTLYRPYIKQGKMDYLYDKVGFYDTLKVLMQGKGSAQAVLDSHLSVADIAPHMLHFLENHDEQRIASPEFVGDPLKGKPAMVVSHLISTAPSMIYFGQTLGEDGSEQAGFGSPSRTSIFDYIGVPEHQKWMNDGKFDGALLSNEQKALRNYYVKLLNLAKQPAIAAGEYQQVTLSAEMPSNAETVMAFGRKLGQQKLLVVSNFNAEQEQIVTVNLPKDWHGAYNDILESHPTLQLQPTTDGERVNATIALAPLASAVYQVEK
ncbi:MULTISPECIES: alpha-amylase family glycosyl hydrolase [unclassified Pseudoalteromonas]|uniref:alpha-amylase family glycosyl hydrolase n=1 Tax=unclassified Pseudoalteromonas TaxID=194690 RepID=UPI001F2C35B8|nr:MULTISPECIES: alpha-amylase family glycosyl hydrolase [unclassified Pseudoalteromonas]MCF2826699.1 alpha-amylase family protein [Pseudoalteromonas sp. OF5H-5]MCF2831594.1 alpha-amylase family protein [Pseudoalteromonas sp. DL2-H6]MCF2926512.1 alpha-amylase family protein [Pseudoalteromonas sp. DL2-H1]